MTLYHRRLPAACMLYPMEKSKFHFFMRRAGLNFEDCCVRWSQVESAETKIAIRAAACGEVWARAGASLSSRHRQQDQDHHESLPFPTQASYHRRCYQQFCNVGKLVRAEIRMEKRNAEGRFNFNFRFQSLNTTQIKTGQASLYEHVNGSNSTKVKVEPPPP